MDSDGRDPFVSMMTAESKVTLNLSDFAPQSMLRVAEHSIERPKFPAVDFHVRRKQCKIPRKGVIDAPPVERAPQSPRSPAPIPKQHRLRLPKMPAHVARNLPPDRLDPRATGVHDGLRKQLSANIPDRLGADVFHFLSAV